MKLVRLLTTNGGVEKNIYVNAELISSITPNTFKGDSTGIACWVIMNNGDCYNVLHPKFEDLINRLETIP